MFPTTPKRYRYALRAMSDTTFPSRKTIRLPRRMSTSAMRIAITRATSNHVRSAIPITAALDNPPKCEFRAGCYRPRHRSGSSHPHKGRIHTPRRKDRYSRDPSPCRLGYCDYTTVDSTFEMWIPGRPYSTWVALRAIPGGPGRSETHGVFLLLIFVSASMLMSSHYSKKNKSFIRRVRRVTPKFGSTGPVNGRIICRVNDAPRRRAEDGWRTVDDSTARTRYGGEGPFNGSPDGTHGNRRGWCCPCLAARKRR